MTNPTCIKAEILRDLITHPFITEQDYSYNSFRMRLSELRNDLGDIEIKSEWTDFTNHYGRKNKYKKHYILKKDLKEAKKVYDRINKILVDS